MVTIELKDIKMYAYHGIHDGEEKVGSPYLINLEVSYEEEDTMFESLLNTVDYEVLYDLLKQRMSINTLLLERLCSSIISKIKHRFPLIDSIRLSIYKLEAPIENLQGKIGVTMYKKFNED